MGEQSSGGGSRGPVVGTIYLVIIVMLILYLSKIYIRDPDHRYIEVCYLPHKVAHVFWVDFWGLIVPSDNASLIKHSRDLEAFFYSCTKTAKGWQLLRSI